MIDEPINEITDSWLPDNDETLSLTLCSDIQREGIKFSPDPASKLFSPCASRILDSFDEAVTKYSSVTNQPISGAVFERYHEFSHITAIVIDEFDAITDTYNSEEPIDEAFYQIVLKRYESFIEHALDGILRLTALLKKLTAAAIRLQYIANAINNRISRNPTPYKKEPPIGGVKVGGEQYRNHRHVARTLYLRQPFFSNDVIVALIRRSAT
jgi:hypothetical protein